jgi:hypothetical protein
MTAVETLSEFITSALSLLSKLYVVKIVLWLKTDETWNLQFSSTVEVSEDAYTSHVSNGGVLVKAEEKKSSVALVRKQTMPMNGYLSLFSTLRTEMWRHTV